VKKQYKYGYCASSSTSTSPEHPGGRKAAYRHRAQSDGLITDYHLNESPMIEEGHFKHLNENDTFIRSWRLAQN
jgi:hypothetical protein